MSLLDTSKRTSSEYIVLSLTAATAIALLPFAVHRLLSQDWGVAALDSVVVLLMAGFFFYVYKTRKTQLASMFVAIIFLATEIVTIYLKGWTQIVWAYPATIGVYFLVNVWNAATLNLICMMILTALVGRELPSEVVSSIIISLTSTNVFVLIFSLRIERKSRMLEKLNYVDGLTGAGNRPAFTEMLKQTCSESPADNSLCLLLFDIDGFMKINDEVGHNVGDKILKELARLVQTQLHEDSELYRLSGGEFVVAPIKSSARETSEFAERLRAIIANATFTQKVNLTVTIAVASNIRSESAKSWLERTEKALYHAKQHGPNHCVVVS